jgi:trimeric autotransporter adhesin
MAYQPKSYRKFLAGSVSAALVATAIAPTAGFAAAFTDVNENDVHAEAIQALVEAGYIKGFEDGTFKPYNNITRGQVAKIFARILKDGGMEVPADLNAFEDVPVDHADQELVEAAALVKEAGVMTGSEGKLNPAQNMTRQQMAKVIVETFGLELPEGHVSEITDLDQADAYAREYIQILEAHGVTTVTEFKPKSNVTRAQFASFIYRAMNVVAEEEVTAADIEAVTVVDANTLEVTFNGELTEVNAEDFSIEGVEIESVEIKASAAADDVKTVVVIKTKTALEEGKSYTVAYKGETSEKTTVEVPVVTPMVESVSAINLKEVEIKFNKEVDKSSAEDEANYTVEGTTVSVATLSADKKSVILTLASAQAQDAVKEVKVENVKVADKSAEFPAKSEKVTFVDVTRPTVEKTEVVGNKALKVYFSEPVTTATATLKSNFKLNGELYVGQVSIDTTGRVVTFTKDFTEGSNTLTINGVKDFSGLTIENDTQVEFTAVKDTTAPTAEVLEVKPNSVKLKFSEDVKLDNAKVWWSNKNADDTADQVANAGTIGTLNANNEVEVTWSGTLPLAGTTLYVKGVKDLSGNEISPNPASFNVKPEIDTTRPEVVSVVSEKEGELVVTFSEKVTDNGNNAGSALNEAHYVIKDKDGKTVTIGDVAVFTATTGDDAYKKVKIVDSALKAGEYTIEITGITDQAAIATNTLIPFSGKVTVPDGTAPTVSSVITSGSLSTGYKLLVNYSEKMSTTGDSSILDASKYMLNVTLSGGATKTIQLPSGTTLTAKNDGKSVEIALPAGFKVDGTAVTAVNSITAQLVKDANGNYISGLTQTVSSFTADTLVVEKVEATDKKTLKVTLSKEIQNAYSEDFVVTFSDVDAGTVDVTNYTYENKDGKGIVYLTLAKEMKAALNSGADTIQTVTVTTVANPAVTKTILGTALQGNNSAVAADKIKASVAVPTDNLLDVGTGANADKVTITFDEDVKLASGSVTADVLANAFVVKDSEGNVLRPVFDYTIALGSMTTSVAATSIELHLLKDGVEDKLTISMNANDYLVDAAGNTLNALTATTTDGKVKELQAPTVVTAAGDGNGDGETLANGASITIEFSEVLSDTAKSDVETAIDTAAGAALDYSWNGATLTVTNNTGSPVNFAADVTANIEDKVGNTTSGAVLIAE